jgi:DNA polymerase III gamma/tau subunit
LSVGICPVLTLLENLPKTAQIKGFMPQDRRAYHQQWSKQNRDKLRKYHQQWRKQNPDKVAESERKSAAKRREKINEYQRERYAQNRERERERVRKWQADNPEAHRLAIRKTREKHREIINAKQRERSRQWRKDNPERMLQQGRDWRAKNPERARAKALAAHHKARAENPEKFREWQRKWRAENPHAVRADNHRRRARYQGSYTPQDIEQLFTVQQGKCAACGTVLEMTGRSKYHIDHIVPLKPRKGFPAGTNDPGNLQLLCMPCNRSKNNLDPSLWAGRLKHRRTSD